MKHYFKQPIGAIETYTGANLFVEDLSGMYMLYVNKEQATPYLSKEHMYFFLCALVAIVPLYASRFDAATVTRLCSRAIHEKVFDDALNHSPDKMYKIATQTRRIMMTLDPNDVMLFDE